MMKKRDNSGERRRKKKQRTKEWGRFRDKKRKKKGN